MKLIDGIKLNGRKRVEIPDCGRDDLPQFFVDLGFKKGAEIGVYKGEYTKKFCEVGLEIYAVDPWKIYKDYHFRKQAQERQDFLYDHTKRYLAPYKNCKIVRKTSMEAADDFKDESLDFVYIDGNHTFRYVAEDICEWSKKVRKGGIISGHDYGETINNPNSVWALQVKYVVDAYVRAFQIKKYYILGRRIAKEGEKRDHKFRSWMWFKP